MSTPIHNSVRSLTCKVFVCVVAGLLLLSIASDSQAQSPCKKCTSPPKVDWTTRASHYTHDPYGNRVDQYAQAVAPPSYERPDFQRSGYRHYRSTIQAGNSADNLHVVEEWGNPVRPYEEWRFPFRPYSAPYGLWGPQPPAVGILPANPGLFGPNGANFLNAPFGFPNGFPGLGFPNGNPPNPNPGPINPGPINPGPINPGPINPGFPNPGFQNQFQNQGTGQPPWIDGYWPQAPQERQLNDRQFFNIPRP